MIALTFRVWSGLLIGTKITPPKQTLNLQKYERYCCKRWKKKRCLLATNKQYQPETKKELIQAIREYQQGKSKQVLKPSNCKYGHNNCVAQQ